MTITSKKLRKLDAEITQMLKEAEMEESKSHTPKIAIQMLSAIKKMEEHNLKFCSTERQIKNGTIAVEDPYTHIHYHISRSGYARVDMINHYGGYSTKHGMLSKVNPYPLNRTKMVFMRESPFYGKEYGYTTSDDGSTCNTMPGEYLTLSKFIITKALKDRRLFFQRRNIDPNYVHPNDYRFVSDKDFRSRVLKGNY